MQPRNPNQRTPQQRLARFLKRCGLLLRGWSRNPGNGKPFVAIDAQELEPRVLYDASPLGAAFPEPIEPIDQKDYTPTADHDIDPLPGWALNPLDPQLWEPALPEAVNDPSSIELPNQPELELIAIDARVLSRDSLLEDLSAFDQGTNPVEVMVIDADSNGINAISERLKTHRNVSSIHLIAFQDLRGTHLGQADLNPESIPALTPTFSLWRQSLATDANVLLYGWWDSTGSAPLQLAEQTLLWSDPGFEETFALPSASQSESAGYQLLDDTARTSAQSLEHELEQLLGVTAELATGWLDHQPLSAAGDLWSEAVQQAELDEWNSLPTPQLMPQVSVADAAANEHRQLVFIDSQLPDLEQLISAWSLADGQFYTVVVLDSTGDGLQFISNYLANSGETFSAIHLLTHGFAGGLQLGSTTLTSGSLDLYADELAAWQLNLTADADLLLYGCYIADGMGGQQFVADLARVTGRDVAASTDATGYSLLGGDWELEYQVGQLAQTSPLIRHLDPAWQHLLLTYTVRDEFTSAAYTNNNGTNSWIAGWSETDSGGAGATTGHFLITGGQLRLQPGNTANVLSRQANLTGAHSATLTFNFDSTLDDNASNSTITVDASSNGTTWTTLDTFTRTTNTVAGNKSYDLTSYISAQTSVRFTVTTANAGAFYLFVDNFQISYDINTAPTAVADTATAVEAGGVSNGTAGTNPTGNVLTNDTDADAGDTKTVTGVAAGVVGSASGNVGSSVTGSFGSISIAANGSYTYTVDNNNATVQALRTSGNTLTDTFTYTMRDALGLTSTTQITVTIQGANDAPSDITGTLTIAENSANGTAVGTVTGTDVDTGDTRTWSLTDSAGGRFAINSSTGQVTVANSSLLNFESATSHNITIRVTDTAGATFDKVLGVTISDVAETLTLTSGSDTFADTGVTETSINAGDGDDTITASSGNDNLTGGNGTDTVSYETTPLYTENFQSGATGWSSNTTESSANLTSFLGRFSGSGGAQAVSKTFSLPTNPTQSAVEFDLYRINTWDNESFNVFINDSQVVSVNLHHAGTISATSGTTGNVSWTANSVSYVNSDFGNSQIIRFSLIVTTPGTSLKLGFGSGLNEDINNESYGIDNLSISTGSAVNVNLSSATAQNTGGSGTDTLQQFENLTGSAFNDTLTGDAGNNVLRGSGGSDTLTGGAGADTFNVDSGTDSITDLGNGADILIVAAGATANATAVASWTATSASSNTGTVNITAAGQNINLSAVTVTSGWTITNSGNATAVTLVGSTNNDTITGGSGADTITGGGGSEMLTGGAGNDTFNVDSGTDYITDLGNGADILTVSAGTTAVVTASGNWTATASSANSGTASITVSGFNINVSAATGASGWTLTNSGNATAVTLTGSANADVITAGSGNDNLSGGNGNDTFTGGAGNDTIDGGVGTDTVMYSSAYSDYSLTWFAGGFTIVDLRGGSPDGTDTVTNVEAITFSNGTFTLNSGTNNNDTLTGTAANEYLAGFNLDDTINGGDGDDILDGGDGNDTLNGQNGNDILVGGLGTDILTGGAGNDTQIGGTGNDTFTVDAGTDTITDLGNGSDILVVSAGATANASAAGAWTATASTSNAGTATVTASGFNINVSSASGSSGWTLTNSGNATGVTLTGTDKADTLTGGSGNDTLVGSFGNDTLTGGAGNDTFTVASGTDTITDLGNGADIVNISAGATANATAAAAWTATASTSNAGTASVTASGFNINVSAATGASGWTLTNSGNATGVTLTGSANADLITGGSGNDTLEGRAGSDTLTGGIGTDTLAYDNSSTSVRIDLSRSAAEGGDAAGDTYSGIENVRGSANADALFGDQNNNQIDGGVGNDLILGGVNLVNDSHFTAVAPAGSYTIYSAGQSFGGWTVTAGTVDLVKSYWDPPPTGGQSVDTSGTTVGTIEQTLTTVAGNTYELFFYMTSGLTGANTRSLTLNVGGQTQDFTVTTTSAHTYSTMEWTAQYYTFTATSSSTTISFTGQTTNWGAAIGAVVVTNMTAAQGTDILDGGSGDDTLMAGGGNDTLTGGSGNDTLMGGAGNDTFTGGAGNDFFKVDAGTDSITDLGNGSDILTVSSGATANATVAGAWTATASSSNSGTAVLTASGFNINVSATSGSSGWTLTNSGNTTAVTLTGSLRPDTLVGGTGADTLFGGGGNDLISGGDGNDTLNGASGIDTISGGLGDDTLIGGGENDTLTGDAGNDTFTVDFGTDTITDLGNGVDILNVSATATANATVAGNWSATSSTSNFGTVTINGLGSNVNVSAATGTSGWTLTNAGATYQDSVLTGSANNDILIGGGFIDTLVGGAGNDSLTGGAGNDSFTGGTGNDTFTIDSGSDTITDFGSGADILNVSAGATVNATAASGWTATASSSNAGTATISANGFNLNFSSATGASGWTLTNAGNSVAVTLTGSANTDTLIGGSGDDSLNAGGGDDLLVGGDGNDSIYGAAGTDYAVYSTALAGVNVNLALTTAQDTGGAGIDTLLSIEGVDGSNFNDTITGNSSDNALWGRSGNDTLTGGGGNDSLLGGTGNDTAVFSGNWRDYTITTGSDANGTYYQLVDSTAARDGTDRIYDIESVQFADGTVSAGSLMNAPPIAAVDFATAVEAGGVSNGTAGTNPSGNVLTNDTDTNSLDTRTVTGVAAGSVGSASGNVGSSVNGTYGSISIAANGSYTYTVDNNNATVQALRTTGNTLTDTFTYTITDSWGLTSTTQVMVAIQGANDAPSDITGTLTIAENSANGAVAGTVTGQDVDTGDSLTYSLFDTAGGRFAINSSTGQVTVANGSLLDFETATSHNLTVRATDTAGVTFDKVMSVAVTNTNEAPTFVIGDGIVTTEIGAGDDEGWAVVMQSDGKIVLAGRAMIGSGFDFALVRYNANGSLDSSFGTGGRVITSFGGGFDAGLCAAIQPDGKILVAGVATVGSNTDVALVRYNTDGSLDTSFGTGGKVTTAINVGSSSTGYGITLQSDGKVIVAGSAGNGSNDDFALVRYNANGTLDTSFGGGDGIVTTAIGTTGEYARSVTLQPDGKIVLGGYSEIGGNFDFALVRYNPDGSLDSSFGTGGKVTTAIGTGMDIGQSVTLQSDGKIVVGGGSRVGSNLDFALVRYNADGSLDTTFGTGGKVTTALSASVDQGNSVTIQSDGKIVVGGTALIGSAEGFALVRYNADGSLDNSFGTGGKVTTTTGSGWAKGLSVTLQSDGRLVVGGIATSGGTRDFALVRYNADGSLDLTFDQAGATLGGAVSYTENGSPVVLDSDVRIFDAELSSSSFNGATLTLVRNGGANSEDLFTSTGALTTLTQGGNLVVEGVTIGTVTTNSNGMLVLTFNSNASNALVNSALQKICYSNSSGTPPASVQINWTFNDGNSGAQGTGGAYTVNGNVVVNISSTNDAPILNSTASPTLSNVLEGAVNPSGVTVAALVVDGSITDPDGSAVEAIAITGLNTSLGTWQYSLDGGTSWLTIDATQLNSNTNELALLLGPTAQLRLIPFGDLNGSVNDAITFRAWDQTSGSEGQYTVITATGGASAFSTASDTASITVTAVNDAPTFLIGDGIVTTDIGTGTDQGTSVAVQPDGKIVVAGVAWIGSTFDFALVRYNVDGTLDTSFGTGGIVTTDLGTANDVGYSLTIQPDGKMVVGGWASNGSNDDFALVRYKVDGTLDTAFGIGGMVTTDIGIGDNSAWSVTLQADGKIVLAGAANLGSGDDFTLVRYNVDGTLDTSFGSGGIVTTDIGTYNDLGWSVTVQPNGKIVLAGVANLSGGDDFALVRYEADGSLDYSFGTDGVVMTDIGTGNDQGWSVTVQPDGKIVVAGCAWIGSNFDFALVRYDVDGSLDTSFGTGGIVTTDIGTYFDQGFSVTVQPDGKLVVAGYANISGDNDFALVRYNPDGTPDTTFGTDGIVTTDIGTGYDFGWSVTVQTDGKIVVSGYSTIGGADDFTVVRYNADGSLDTTFDLASTLGGSVSYTENGSPVVLDSDVQIFDVELSSSNFSGATLTLVRNGGANGEDLFSATGTLGALTQGGNLVVDGTTIGTVTSNSGGSLVLTFNSSATNALVNSAMQQIAYANASTAPPSSVEINWTFSDGNSGDQGIGGALTATGSVTVNISGANDAPTAVADSANAIEAGGIGNGTAGSDPTGNVLANDTDPDAGDTHIVIGVASGSVPSASGNVGIHVAGSYGQIHISSNGDYVYLVDNGNAAVQALRTSGQTLTDTFTYTIEDAGGLTSTAQVNITISGVNDAPHDITGTLTVSELAGNGASAGTVIGQDADSGESFTYQLIDNAGGRFAINSSTGEVTVANGSLLDYETNSTHQITVRVTDLAGASYETTLTVNITDDNDASAAVADSATAVEAGGVNNGTAGSNPTGNVLTNDTDPDAGDSKTVTGVAAGIVGSAAGNVGSSVSGTYGSITIAADGSYTYTVDNTNAAVQALRTSANTLIDTFTYTMQDAGGLSSTTQVTITIQGSNDAPHDLAGTLTIAENSANGSTTGTIIRSDVDAGDTATYSLVDNAGGRFAINSSTGVVTVANSALLNFEAATSHNITVRVTDAAGATFDKLVTVTLTDVDEFDVGPVTDINPASNNVHENAVVGTVVGITASASDADATNNTITYSLEGSASGRFAVDSSTGVVTVAGALDYETSTSHSITVRATSSDGSFSTQVFTIQVNDVNEGAIGPVADTNAAANFVLENSSNGTLVGLTGLATDPDGSDTVSYSLDDSAGGRFAINSSTGVVTVAGGIDREAAGSYNIIVRATSSDTSFSTQSFTITIGDVDEFDVGTVSDSNASSNNVNENAVAGTTVGITASASDADATTNTIAYTLTNNDGGRFAIDSSTGVVTVAGAIDREADGATRSITVRATSADGSFTDQIFTIAINDLDEFDVTPVVDVNAAANSLAENSANGTAVGITASASDQDVTTNTINYSLDDNAGGRFAINSSTGVVTVADGSLLNCEAATSHNITIRATSADGSFSTQSFTINLTDVDEFDVGPVSDSNTNANSVAENAANGTFVEITASASDADATASTITYSLDDNAGGRFTIDSSTGVVTVANGTLLNREAAASHTITVRATSADSSFSTQTFTISLTDVDEFNVGSPGDSNAAANSVAENAANGTLVGLTVFASDPDATTNTITYSLDNSAGGRFTIDSSTGVVTVANGTLLDREAAASYTITARATSADSSFSSTSFTINLTDVDEFDVGSISDTNASANTVAENAANGTVVGITASASDADATTNTITYSLDNDASGRFAINSSTGVVTVADSSLLNFEAATSHNITIRATSADGSFSTQSFTINLTDVDEFDVTPVVDVNAAANSLAENSANGTLVGITASATDQDGTTNGITYSLDNDASGRFAINSSTGVVTVADSSLLNFEAATSHNITIRATSADGSFSTQSFTINLTDIDEFDVTPVVDVNAAANSLAENSANGTAVGITASASDQDGTTNTVNYSLDDNAGGRFAVNSSTGVVTVADGSLLNYEAAMSHAITIRATSADGSFSTQSFTINLTDVDEFDVTPVVDVNAAANSLAENSANGTLVGITASATDQDGTTNGITYSLDNNAGGRFAINTSTGVVTVADSSLLNFEAATSHDITIRATSADGSFSTQSFTINLTDVDEFDVTPVVDVNAAANSLAENSANGTAVGITASAADQDGTTNTVNYSLDDNAGGRFTVNSSTGVVTVADGSLLNYEAAMSHAITIRATSADGSFSTQSFTINLTDVDEFDVTPVVDVNAAANSLAENSVNGTLVGITASASDQDGTTNTVNYSLDDNAGGRFAVNSSTGVVTVADGSLLNYEAATSHNITIRATSADGSFSTQSFTINLTDVDEFDVTPVVDVNAAANSLAENSANGTAVGITASASDQDGTTNTINYSLDDNAGGRFAVNSSTGVVTVADGSLLNYEAATSHSITIRATSADGSFSTQSFTINLTDVDEFDVTPVVDLNAAANSLAENSVNGTLVGITASASDQDGTTNTVNYSLDDNAGGRFAINSSTGVVTVADGSLLNYEAATSHNITIRATSADGSFSNQSFTINLTDVDEFDVTPVVDVNAAANSLAENSANGTAVGITASASDQDGTTNTVNYSIDDNAGGRFTVNSSTGVVTVADGSLLNYEAATSHSITIRATSADGSFSTQSFTINLTDVDEFDVTPVVDVNAAANSLAENSANGTAVGITASAADQDGTTNTVNYSLDDNAGGRFAINSSTGVVTVADGSLLNYEAATSHNITIRATSADGSFSTQSFTINLTDVDEFDVGAVSDVNAASNNVNENAAIGTTVGITASGSDADATNNTINYSLTDNDGGRFAINSSTGVVTVAGAIDREADGGTRSITVRATSADGSFTDQVFTIAINDDDEFDVNAVIDANATSNNVNEEVVVGTTVGITASASDADATTNAITFSLDDSAGGRFAVDSSTGVVTVAGAIDYETSTSHSITVRATSADGSFSTQVFTIQVNDVNEGAVGPVTDSNAAANFVIENSANGTLVGLTGLATDPDGSDTVSYSLDDSAGGRFAINSSTGVVTVAGGIDREAAGSYNITIRATSSDASFSTQSFTITIGDVDEFDVTPVVDVNAAANSLAENSANGTLAGITASAMDQDGTTNTINYSLDDNAGGRFAIDPSTGVVSVANSSLLNYEATTSHSITIRATSADGSFTTQSFIINLTDVDEYDVSAVSDINPAANSVAENAAAGSTVGLTAFAADSDSTNNAITYTLTDDDGGRFAINSSTGAVMTTRGLDRELDGAVRQVTIRATSADGSWSEQTFTIDIQDQDEFDVTIPADVNSSPNFVAENSAAGSLVGITAQASDTDATTNLVTYSLSNNDGGRFAIDPVSGVVTTTRTLDREVDGAQREVTVRATSADGSFAEQNFTIDIGDLDEFDVTAPADVNAASNFVAENSATGSLVGITAQAADSDSTNSLITYSLSNDDGGRFAIDPVSGVVTTTRALDREIDGASRQITIRSTSADGSTAEQVFIVSIGDIDEADVTVPVDVNPSANQVAENAAIGSAVGLTISAHDSDATQSIVSYQLLDSAGGRFAIDALTGVVTVAGPLDYETATTHTILVRATSQDGSAANQSFTINVLPLNDNTPQMVTPTSYTVGENQLNIGFVGGTDADLPGPALSYTISGGADAAKFMLNPISGQLQFVGLQDFEAPSDSNTNGVYEVRIRVSDGQLWSEQLVQVTVADENDQPVVISDNWSMDEDTTLNQSVLANDSDQDADPLTVELLEGPENAANFALNSDGTFNYRPAENWYGTDGFRYRISDGRGGTSEGNVTLQVQPVNDAPISLENVFTVLQGSTLETATGVLNNDMDIESEPLIAILVAPPTRGVITFRVDGSFLYKPEIGFIGTDNFTYIASDGVMAGTPTTVWVQVDVGSGLPSTPPPPPAPFGDSGNSGGSSSGDSGSSSGDSSSGSGNSDTGNSDSSSNNDSSGGDNSNTNTAGTDSTDATPQAGQTQTGTTGVSGDDEQLAAGSEDRQLEGGSAIRLEDLQADVLTGEERLIGSFRIRDFIAAQTAIGDGEEVDTSRIEVNGKMIEVSFNRRQLWEQLAYLQRQVEEKRSLQSDSSLGEIALEIGTATMAASLGYVLWFLRGSAMMATAITQIPSWKMIDPLVILDSRNTTQDSTYEDQDIINSYFENASND